MLRVNTRIAVSLGSAAAGVLLLAGAVGWHWRSVEPDPGFHGSVDQSVNAAGQLIGGWLFSVLVLALFVEAATLSGGFAQTLLKATGTVSAGVAVTLLLFIASDIRGTVATPSWVVPTAHARVGPGPAVLLAVAGVLALLNALWWPPKRTPARTPRSVRWYLGLLLFAIGLLAQFASGYLPFWTDVFAGEGRHDHAASPFLVLAVPTVVANGLALASLLLAGPAQRVLRLVCWGWLAATCLGCGGLTGVFWLLQATDVSALDRGLQYTRPGNGLLAGLIAAIVAPLSGAIARNLRTPSGPPSGHAVLR